MRAQRGGFTVIELVVSSALFGTMLAAIWASFATGQAAFTTSEGRILADQDARAASVSIEQDLTRARIESYYRGWEIQGNGKEYVKFRRMDPASSAVINDQGDPAWSAIYHMYLWCPNGTITVGVMGRNVCAQLRNADNSVFQPTGRQLLLVRSAPGNPGGEIGGANGLWTVERIVTNNLQNPLADAADGQGFSVDVLDPNGTALGRSADVGAPACTTTSPGAWEACVNVPGNSFTLLGVPGGYQPPATRLSVQFSYTIRTRMRTTIGQIIRAHMIRNRVQAMNVQDLSTP